MFPGATLGLWNVIGQGRGEEGVFRGLERIAMIGCKVLCP